MGVGPMRLTLHARKRMQQRGFTRNAVDLLAAYGAVDHQRGAELFYFDKAARRAVFRDLGKGALRGMEKSLNAYMVVTRDGMITTIGHRYRRVVRH